MEIRLNGEMHRVKAFSLMELVREQDTMNC